MFDEQTYILSWKNGICSANKYIFLGNFCLFDERKRRTLENCVLSDEQINLRLENQYLFGEHIKPPGKVQKKVLLEEKKKIFSKIVSVAASWYGNRKYFYTFVFISTLREKLINLSIKSFLPFMDAYKKI